MEARRLHRILIVDDDVPVRKRLSRAFSGQGICSRTARDGCTGLEILLAWRPDILICELSIRSDEGLPLWREVLQRSNAPIIIISSKCDEEAKSKVLNGGVADYISKPLDLSELRLAVAALLRQLSIRRPAGSSAASSDPIEVGAFKVDRTLHKVTVKDREIHLTPKEFELIALLASHPNQLIRHATLSKRLWSDGRANLQNIHVLVAELRKKIETTSEPRYILNEFRLGYRFDPYPE